MSGTNQNITHTGEFTRTTPAGESTRNALRADEILPIVDAHGVWRFDTSATTGSPFYMKLKQLVESPTLQIMQYVGLRVIRNFKDVAVTSPSYFDDHVSLLTVPEQGLSTSDILWAIADGLQVRHSRQKYKISPRESESRDSLFLTIYTLKDCQFCMTRLLYARVESKIWLLASAETECYVVDDSTEYFVTAMLPFFGGDSSGLAADLEDDGVLSYHSRIPWSDLLYHDVRVLVPQSSRKVQKKLEATLCHKLPVVHENERPKTPPPFKAYGRIVTPKSSSESRKKMKNQEISEKRLRKLAKLFPQAGSWMPKIGIDAETSDVIKGFSENINTLMTQMPEFTKTVNDASSNGVGIKHDFTSLLTVLPQAAAVLLTGYMSIRTRDKRWIGGFVTVAGLIAFVNWKQSDAKLRARFEKLVQKVSSDQIEPQSFDQDSFKTLAEVATLLTFGGMASTAKLSKVSNAFMGISALGTMGTKIQDGLTFVVKILEKIINVFRDKVLGYGPIRLLNDIAPELKSWCNKIDRIVEESHKGKLAVNSANAARIFALQQESRNLTSKKTSMVDNAAFRNCLGAYTNTLNRLAQPFEQANIVNGGIRVEPLAVMIKGKSGVGKSMAVTPVVKKVLYNVLPEEQKDELRTNFMDFVYNRQPEHRYWDGYRSHFCTWLDDFGQVQDVAGNPDNEFMEIVRMINITPNILHMADIASKGNNTFASKLVVATTNMERISPNSIIEPEAVIRRFDLIFELTVKREWSIGQVEAIDDRRPDLAKIRAKFGDDYAPEINEYRLCRYDSSTKQSVRHSGPMSQEQLVEMITSAFQAKMARGERYLESQSGEQIDPDEIVELQMVEPEADPLNDDIDIDAFLETASEDHSVYQDYLSWLLRMKTLGKLDEIRACAPHHAHLSRLEHSFVMCDLAPKLFESAMSQGRLRQYFAKIITSSQYRDIQEMTTPLRDRADSKVLRLLKKARAGIDEAFAEIANRASEISQKHPYIEMALKIIGMVGLAALAITATKKAFDLGGKLGKKTQAYFSDKMMQSPQRLIPWDKPRDCYRNDHDFETCEHDCYPQEERDRLARVAAAVVEAESGGPRKSSRKHQVKTVVVGLRPQSGDINNDQMTAKIIRKNLYRLVVDSDDSMFELGDVVFVKGQLAVMPAHFVKQLKVLIKDGTLESDGTVFLNNRYTRGQIQVDVREILAAKIPDFWEDSDLCITHITTAMQHADGSNWFISPNYARKASTLTLRLFSSKSDANAEDFGTFVPGFFEEGLKCTNTYDDDVSHWKLQQAVRYRIPTKAGDCGTLVSVIHTSIGPGKICGIHVAGDGVNGFASVITSADVAKACALFSVQHPLPTELELMPQCCEVPFEGNFVPLVKAKDHGQSVKTKICPSKIFGCLGPSTHKPARLARWRDGDRLRDPLIEAVSKYGRQVKRVDRDLLVTASDSYYSYLTNHNHRSRRPMVFSFEIACQGLQDVDFCNPIPRSTSAGYPYVLNPKAGYKGKEWYFGHDEQYDFNRPQAIQLRADVMEVIEKAKRGERSLHVYVDTLKDETLKNHKADIGKTRLVSAAPIVLTVVLRMYFLDFCMFIMEGGTRLGTAVGLNVYSHSWDILARELNLMGDKKIAGDYSEYDASAEAEEYREDARLINNWYAASDEDRMVRETLMEDVVNSLHLCRGSIYAWLKSMPSGVFLTTILNCLRNQNNMRRCFIILAPKPYTIADFDKYVCYKAYGDDGVGSVSDVIAGWFNQETITRAMATIGYTYTDEDKTGVVHTYRPLSEVSFLKRKFRYSEEAHRYVAPLSFDSIREMTYWSKLGAFTEDITRTNVDNALRELSLHGEEDFHHWGPMVVAASREHLGYQPPIVDYRAWLSIALKHEDHY